MKTLIAGLLLTLLTTLSFGQTLGHFNGTRTYSWSIAEIMPDPNNNTYTLFDTVNVQIGDTILIQNHNLWDMTCTYNGGNYVGVTVAGDLRQFVPLNTIVYDLTMGDGFNTFTINITYNTPTSVKNVTKPEFELSVFPNPVVDVLKVKVSEKTDLVLMDLNGRVLKQNELSVGENEVGVSELPNGVYLTKVGTKTIKVLKN